ncbi:hypothetical protein V6N11_060687 [Hibiscus sabdariffa]|uniref:Uncharacterized protein n=2 Tax=Hibiscus sabdariffa TaxID=183260 RepID=A0ABR2AJP7_9ROSI
MHPCSKQPWKSYRIQRGRTSAARGRGGRDGVIPDWVELAGLFTRMRGVLSVQKGDGELQVLRGRVLPHRVQVHVQRQILPCSFLLTICFSDIGIHMILK